MYFTELSARFFFVLLFRRNKLVESTLHSVENIVPFILIYRSLHGVFSVIFLTFTCTSDNRIKTCNV